MTAVRPPKQRRSRESYERVLDAAHALLEENGFEGLTVQEVAARSGVSVGAIYERFGNKETLLRDVHARLMESMLQSGESAGDPAASAAGAAAAVAAVVAGMARVMNDNRKALRAFMHLGAVDEVISARGSKASIALSKTFKRALMPYATEFGHPEPEVALDVAFRIAYSTLARQVMYGPVFESDRRLSWKRLVDEIASACAAYLLNAPSA
ncbi:MAG: TetR/AcrR family transcriptional regulator [Solirubrobacterales bacterium]|nr:TetR/AcrR family transcriptional regulator [Solirubrobacterales bacterium]